ncbi:MAG: FkbM family methyltransferase [Flavobacteriaceae bacterium]|nr:FkbM family methyltransferase [Flavobacteriaceae bacterium]
MKQILLGSMLGRFLFHLRDIYKIGISAIYHPADTGMIANDQMATRLVTTLCQSGKTFVDVGAHIGSIISSVKNHDNSINIIAIEAIPNKVKSLKNKYPDITIYDCAVGESEGETTFYINKVESGYSSLIKPVLNDSNKVTEICVPIKRLDNLMTNINIDVIKIDVEGAELGVLRGAKTLISKNRPTIMFESAPDNEDDACNLLGYTKADMHKWLTEQQYEIIIPIRVAHNAPGLELSCFLESHLYPRRTTNYFAIPSERRLEIRDKARKLLNIK